MTQSTWGVTTDVLWQSSRSRRKKGKPRHTKAPTSEREGETFEDGNEQTYRDLEQEVKEAEPGTSKKSTTRDAADAKAKAMEQKSDAEEAAARAASAASAASTAAADGQPTTKAHVAASEGTVASEAQATKEKDEKIRALIQERKSIEKHEKERIREIRRSWKKSKEHLGRSVMKRILIPKIKNKRRRNYQNEARNRKCICEIL